MVLLKIYLMVKYFKELKVKTVKSFSEICELFVCQLYGSEHHSFSDIPYHLFHA